MIKTLNIIMLFFSSFVYGNNNDIIEVTPVLRSYISCVSDSKAHINVRIANGTGGDIEVSLEHLGMSNYLWQKNFSVVNLNEFTHWSLEERRNNYPRYKDNILGEENKKIKLQPNDEYKYTINLIDFYHLESNEKYFVTMFKHSIENGSKNGVNIFNLRSNTLIVTKNSCAINK